MANITTTVDVALLLQIFGSGGMVWLAWRINAIESKLGNGKKGVFPRREEVQLMIQTEIQELRNDKP